jgi:hypothetical protein
MRVHCGFMPRRSFMRHVFRRIIVPIIRLCDTFWSRSVAQGELCDAMPDHACAPIQLSIRRFSPHIYWNKFVFFGGEFGASGSSKDLAEAVDMVGQIILVRLAGCRRSAAADQNAPGCEPGQSDHQHAGVSPVDRSDGGRSHSPSP